MPHLTQIEMQCLRHMLGEELLAAAKAQQYVNRCQDMELRNILSECVTKHQQRAEQLISSIQ